MSLLQAIFLGLVRGITEFLPISSSGHFVILQNIFHIKTAGGMLFNIMLHLGTLTAVCLIYKKDLIRMFKETINMCVDVCQNVKLLLFNKKNKDARRYKKVVHNNYRKFVLLVLISIIPTAIIGYVDRSIVAVAASSLVVPGVCMLLTGVLLLISDIAEDGHKVPKDVSYSNGFIIGVCQGIASLPGLSRTGATISAGLLSGFDRRFAVKYSYIMSIPAILGACILELKDIETSSITFVLFCGYLIASILAGVVAYICIKVMLTIVKKKSFKGFAFYCFFIGIIAIICNFVI